MFVLVMVFIVVTYVITCFFLTKARDAPLLLQIDDIIYNAHYDSNDQRCYHSDAQILFGLVLFLEPCFCRFAVSDLHFGANHEQVEKEPEEGCKVP